MIPGVAPNTQPFEPIGCDEFAALMARLGGFEPHPHLAIAVSGGADSLALALLCQRWAAARGGTVVALTVDHQLRLESTDEARKVGRQLADYGIAHAVLTWHHAAPLTGLQEAARRARYHLLTDHCAAAGILHLLLAHHREDQAETFLLRLAHGSGLDGLSGMAAIRENTALRCLRPLLTVPKARLVATCRQRGITWIEDPSNHAPRFARARLRAATDALEPEGLSAARLAGTTRRLGWARAALDHETARLLGAAAAVDPAGFLWLDPQALASAPTDVGQRALARALAVIGGGEYPPRHERVQRLFAALRNDTAGGRTLAGCRLVPYQRHLLLVRETVAIADPMVLPPGQRIWWDRRFLIRRPASTENLGTITVGHLDSAAWRAVREHLVPQERRAVPEPARATLPTLWDDGGVLAAPHLGYRRKDSGAEPLDVVFAPAQPLAGPVFAVV